MSETSLERARAGKTGRPSRQTSLELTQRILDVATAMFLECGYGASSVDTLAAVACISKRTFYARFPSKADLFEAVIVRYINDRLSGFESEIVACDDLRQTLTDIATGLLKRTLTPETIALDRMITGEVKQFPELARTLYDHGVVRVAGAVGRVIEQAIGRGEIAGGEVDFLAISFIDLTVGPALRRASLGLEPAIFSDKNEVHVRKAVDLFLNGCRRQSGEP
ncbi:TetR/AcrR family transcriptional regulator [Faunimonas pinastri]|uniref:TetR/AcrR family transcriptional regulator n=1 Tax=Faunimonas pinastri TaxID=1855383 RepID=UPI0015A7246F|nr:TetR/AcrR family transcriptional regulator [Faunimonas pinastri]